MKDYDNLVSSLRHCCKDDFVLYQTCKECPYHMPPDADRTCIDELMSEAAEAIVELRMFNPMHQEAARMRTEK